MTVETIALLVSLVSLVSGISGIFFAFKNGKHTDIKDVETRVADTTRLEVKIDNLLTSVNDVKDEVKGQRSTISQLTIKLAEVESSAKQAHKRIDDLTKG